LHETAQKTADITKLTTLAHCFTKRLIRPNNRKRSIYRALSVINSEQILKMPIIQFVNSTRHLKPEVRNNLFSSL